MVVGTKASWAPGAGSAPALGVRLSKNALPRRTPRTARMLKRVLERGIMVSLFVVGNKNRQRLCRRRFHHSLTGSQVTTYRTRVIAPDRLRLSCCSNASALLSRAAYELSAAQTERLRRTRWRKGPLRGSICTCVLFAF